MPSPPEELVPGDDGPAPAPIPAGDRPRPRLAIPLLLLLATFLSTTISGAMQFSTEAAKATSFGGEIATALRHLGAGLSYSVALMAILVAHEAGHALMARRHGVAASLPYFIPLPFTVVGTMGAVIGLREDVRSRNALLDIAAAGPLAGLAVAIPVLALGVHLSPVGPPAPGGLIEGQSLLYLALKYAVKGELLPSAGRDLTLGPVAFAGWVGLLVTSINLVPVGPLDGGHIAAAALGPGHDRRSRLVHRLLPVIGLVVTAGVALLAVRAGRGAEALSLGVKASLPWFVWSGVLLALRRLSGGRWAEPLGADPLTRGRRAVVVATAILYVLLFMPWVMREAL